MNNKRNKFIVFSEYIEGIYKWHFDIVIWLSNF